jgi:hypothetical protein
MLAPLIAQVIPAVITKPSSDPIIVGITNLGSGGGTVGNGPGGGS